MWISYMTPPTLCRTHVYIHIKFITENEEEVSGDRGVERKNAVARGVSPLVRARPRRATYSSSREHSPRTALHLVSQYYLIVS